MICLVFTWFIFNIKAYSILDLIVLLLGIEDHDETALEETDNDNNFNNSLRPQLKSHQKTTNRNVINETDDDEEAVSSLIKLNGKKTTKNASGVVTGSNTTW